ncbi:DNA polymerase [Paenibacillus polymyxa]|uniref:DNA polymerase n=1 Tax=Paenibacillus polymyxa TaxID=1406 RepID=UPI001111B7D2|nr:DNA polymerase [Paenibacillus polymyxa]
MDVLSIDLETFSSVNIKDSGVYPYVESPDFEVLLFAYAFNQEPVRVLDLTDFEDIPADVQEALSDPAVLKTAFNAGFERTALAKHFNQPMPPDQWQCSAVLALTLGLPGSLDQVAKALKLQEQKDSAGKALIKYFSTPCKPTKVNGGRTRNMPWHAPEKWQQYKDYCGQDVETERDLRRRLIARKPSEFEQRLWALDQRINDGGIRIKPEMIQHAIACDEAFQTRKLAEAAEITGLDNPKSVAQLKGWLEDQGLTVGGLTKDSIPVLIEQADELGMADAKAVLKLRQETSKTSVKKYEAMQRARCNDDRVRGLLQFYGANRTGRWAGRLVQVQNLPQNKLADLDLARTLLLEGEYELLELLYASVPGVLSQLVRTAFIPSPGCRFIVSDFSAIEARVIAWLAGESWRMEVFRTHGKIYEASASQMFKVPIEEIGKGNPLRQKGKIAELALGYGGGVGALEAMGALKMGLESDELKPLVNAWRKANKRITKLWWDVDAAAMAAVEEHRRVELQYGLTFFMEDGSLFIQLPSGRCLAYVNPQIKPGKFDKPALTYEGMDQVKKIWTRIDTYGPKLVENIVQAISRDCLAESLIKLDDARYKTVMHVHDEAVLDVPGEYSPNGSFDLDQVVEIMGQPIPWAPGLSLRADGYETAYYRKD